MKHRKAKPESKPKPRTATFTDAGTIFRIETLCLRETRRFSPTVQMLTVEALDVRDTAKDQK
jgi:hypothetical protein